MTYCFIVDRDHQSTGDVEGVPRPPGGLRRPQDSRDSRTAAERLQPGQPEQTLPDALRRQESSLGGAGGGGGCDVTCFSCVVMWCRHWTCGYIRGRGQRLYSQETGQLFESREYL